MVTKVLSFSSKVLSKKALAYIEENQDIVTKYDDHIAVHILSLVEADNVPSDLKKLANEGLKKNCSYLQVFEGEYTKTTRLLL